MRHLNRSLALVAALVTAPGCPQDWSRPNRLTDAGNDGDVEPGTDAWADAGSDRADLDPDPAMPVIDEVYGDGESLPEDVINDMLLAYPRAYLVRRYVTNSIQVRGIFQDAQTRAGDVRVETEAWLTSGLDAGGVQFEMRVNRVGGEHEVNRWLQLTRVGSNLLPGDYTVHLQTVHGTATKYVAFLRQ